MILNACNALRNRNFRKFAAAGKGRFSDARHALRNRDVRKAIAGGKGIISDSSYAIGNCDTRKTGTAVKCTFSDGSHALRNCDAHKAGAVGKNIVSDTCHAFRNGDAHESGAAGKGSASDARHTRRDGNLLQRHAVAKGAGVNTGQALGEDDVCEAATTLKGIFSNARHAAVRRDHAVFATKDKFFVGCFDETISGRVIGGISLRDGNCFQRGTVYKGIVPYACHALGDSNAHKTGAVFKSIDSDSRHARLDNSCFYCRALIIPRRIVGTVVLHSPRAGDGNGAVIGEFPCKIVAARAGSHGICRQQGRLLLRKFILRWFNRRLRRGFHGRLRRRFSGGFRGRLRRRLNGGFRGRLCRRFGGRFRRRLGSRVGLRIAVGYSLRLLLVADRPRRDGKLRGQHDRKKHGKQFLHIPYSPFYVRIYFTLTLHYTLLLEKCKKSGRFFAGFQTGL